VFSVVNLVSFITHKRNTMTLLKLPQLIAVLLTIVTGVVSLLAPRSVQGFTGLTAPVRAIAREAIQEWQ
jgi:hypothetical protein